jgi:hypothetical protein
MLKNEAIFFTDSGASATSHAIKMGSPTLAICFMIILLFAPRILLKKRGLILRSMIPIPVVVPGSNPTITLLSGFALRNLLTVLILQ